MKKIVCCLIAGVVWMALLSCRTNDSKPLETVDLPENSAMAFVSKMGIGINIGNTLDSIGTFTWHSGENGWGNPSITREFIQALKNYGYTTIRLPVTWGEYIGPAPDYTIGGCIFDNCSYSCPNRMDRVEEVVNWILDEGMYCVLNLHHDGGTSDHSWILNASTDTEGTLKKFRAVWAQIAVRFRDASDKLVLEAMNEVGFDDIWNRWNPAASNSKGEAYRILNLLNQAFVDTVRGTGGNNAKRFLVVCGYWTDIDCTIDPLFKMPKDTAAQKPADTRLILSVHYYTPATFCILDKDESWGKNQKDWGSRADYAELSDQMAKLKKHFLDNGVPVLLGEYGVTMKNKVDAARVNWMTAVTQICINYGMCPALWDTGGEISRRAPFAMRDSLKAVWENLPNP